MIDGLAVVDKPAGMTSHDVVGRCRRIFGQKRVGHAGTLDPDATGVLLIGLGRATRLLQFHSGPAQVVRGEIVLGVATTTLDAAGEVAVAGTSATSPSRTPAGRRPADRHHLARCRRWSPPSRSGAGACTSWPARAWRSSAPPVR